MNLHNIQTEQRKLVCPQNSSNGKGVYWNLIKFCKCFHYIFELDNWAVISKVFTILFTENTTWHPYFPINTLMCNNDGIVKCIGRFKTFWYKYQNTTYPYTGNSISSRPHTRTLDEPLSCSSSFILSKQYNIIYTYNMGHDLYLPAHVVNTKGWCFCANVCFHFWCGQFHRSLLSPIMDCAHIQYIRIHSIWKSRGTYIFCFWQIPLRTDYHGIF